MRAAVKNQKIFETSVFCIVFSSNVWQHSVNVKLVIVQVPTHHALWPIHLRLHEGWSYVGLLWFKQPLSQFVHWHRSVGDRCAVYLCFYRYHNWLYFIFLQTQCTCSSIASGAEGSVIHSISCDSPAIFQPWPVGGGMSRLHSVFDPNLLFQFPICDIRCLCVKSTKGGD